MPDAALRVADATPEDVPAIARVMRAVADEGRWIGTAAGTPLATLEARFARAVADVAARHVVLRDAGDEVVGLAGLTRAIPRGAHELGMSIAPGHRGRGGGGLLLDAILAAARADEGVHKVALQVWPHNAAAIGLYVSRGFAVEGVLRDHWQRPDGALWSAVLMGWWPERSAG
jgi:RimJ/RimL family protein N-acetyltransferase